jgi:hypothetical protein
MSRPTARELHDAHADERNRVSRLAKHEDEVRRLVNERWQRKVQATLMTGSRPSDDFDGAVE